jgi:glycosyltransferase involved in cell wall biosynthesis
VAQRALKSDLVFGLGNSVGLWSGLKRGCTIHDLHHRHYPEQYSRLKTLFYKSLAERSWSRSSVRVVPSHFVARELKEFCGLDSRVIPWSPEPCGVGEETAKPKEQKEQKEISREAFFLSVSSGAPHKRVPEMLQAYAAYRKRHGEMKWVHVGPRLKEFEKVVEFVDHCDAQKLRDLYSRAAAYVSASEFEGFGLPVSESLYFGTPVILSQMASHPELTRESEVLWVPREKPGLWTPKDHASWIDAFFGASKLRALPKKSGIHGTRVWMDVAAEYQKAWLEVLG